ncbi:MAG: chemotaxis protein CheW [Clostridia bacterium]|nr:chemotaxis protein CheW [Deltaproteobacteria bacterium]
MSARFGGQEPTPQPTSLPRDTDIVQLAAFRVGAEEYVLDIMRVREILRPVQVTPVRKGPKYVEGVISLRGQVIPIVDMRRRFDVPADSHRHRKIIILVIEGRVLGLIVDGVTEVVRVPRSEIRSAPGLLTSDKAPYFLGVVQYRGRTLILLNVKSIISSDASIGVPSSAEIVEGLR